MKQLRLLFLISFLLLTACASTTSDVQQGKTYFQAGNYKMAFQTLMPAALKSDGDAQYAIGYMYYYGYGVPRDKKAGIYWLEHAAMQDNPDAIKALNMINQHKH